MTATNLFVYGTLMFPEVYFAVTGVHRTTIDGRLYEFRRYALADRTYPAINADNDGFVDGKLLCDVSTAELNALDDFEEVSRGCYVRESVVVESSLGSVEAMTYIAGPLHIPLMEGDWSAELFEKTHLQAYVSRLQRGQ